MLIGRFSLAALAVVVFSQFALPSCALAQDAGAAEEKTVQFSETTEGDALTARDIAYLVSPLISLVGVGIIVFFTRKSDVSEQWLKINEAEANYLQNKLDKFYGPDPAP